MGQFVNESERCGHHHKTHSIQTAHVLKTNSTASQRTLLRIAAMDCPSEAKLLLDSLGKMEGVIKLEFNLFERTLTIEHTLAQVDNLVAAVKKLGMHAEVLGEQSSSQANPRALSSRLQQGLFVFSGLSAIAAEGVAWWQGHHTPWIFFLALLSIMSAGLPILKKGWIALKARTLNIHFLMSVAIGGALAIGQWPEAAMVLFLFNVAERLEALSLERASSALRHLLTLAPEHALVANKEGKWIDTPIKTIPHGSRLRVRPGERVALDGVITVGESCFNEAPITGESLPRAKKCGDPVFAGSINGQAVVEITTTARAEETVLARIIESVRHAQAQRAPTQRFIDRFAAYYTPVVVLCALAVALLLPVFTSLSISAAIYHALVLLVIACPCALVIATPVTLVSALTGAAQHGLLIKGGAALEKAAKVRAIAFDKTGTLSAGQASVTALYPLGSGDAEQLLSLAAALDAHSTHPLARALNEAAASRGLVLPSATAVKEQAGLGVDGVINQQVYALGNRQLARQAGALDQETTVLLDAIEERGHIGLVLTRGTHSLGVISLADTLRSNAAQTIEQLNAMGVCSVILSGDNQHVVDSLAEQSGITQAYGHLLPEDKWAHIEQLQARYGVVAMVGDGINDAPALARADIGIAMGSGSDTALDTAQIALMDNRLEKLPILFKHARRSLRVLKTNLFIALLFKLVFFILALSGLATLWMAVFADVGASLLVVANGLRLSRRDG